METLKNAKKAVISMNEIINNILLTGDKFMSETHLKLSGFMSIA